MAGRRETGEPSAAGHETTSAIRWGRLNRWLLRDAEPQFVSHGKLAAVEEFVVQAADSPAVGFQIRTAGPPDRRPDAI